jgi:hypothetical protein
MGDCNICGNVREHPLHEEGKLRAAIKIGEQHANHAIQLMKVVQQMRNGIFRAVKLARHGKIDEAIKLLEKVRRL